MEIEKLFPVDKINFQDMNEFNNYLVRSYVPQEVEHQLTIFLGITEYDTDNLLNALEKFDFHVMEQLGVVYHIKKIHGDNTIEAYFVHDVNKGVLVFYTNFRKTEEIPFIQKFLEQERHCSPLFIKPSVMHQITNHLIQTYDNLEIIQFSARRLQDSKVYARIRPYYHRSIQYSGADGKEALQEMEYYYGVLPRYIRIHIPNAIDFKVHEDGLFTYYGGKQKNIFFDIISKSIEELISTMGAYRKSAFDFVSIETDRKSFEQPVSRPSLIHANLKFHEIENFEKGLISRDYTIMKSVAMEGSLFYYADIISDNGERIRVKANGQQIKVYPDQNRNISTFMDFYKYIIEEIDPFAELIV